MVISKKDLKNPSDYGVKYDNVSNAAGKLIDQKYADIENFDNMELHNTDEEARKANEAKKERYKNRPVVYYK